MNYESLRTNEFNQWLIIHLRYLLGLAFIPSGLIKLVGERFTLIPVENPIGFFFEGLFQSGFYYNFIGLIQVIAGFLLMSQRLATLGALIYSCLIVNIWMITVSLSFKGTWVITSLMLLATAILLIWDIQKFKFLFSYNSKLDYKVFPDPTPYWQILGVIYFTLLTSLWLLARNGTLAVIISVIIILLFICSNIYAYIKYKKKSAKKI